MSLYYLRIEGKKRGVSPSHQQESGRVEDEVLEGTEVKAKSDNLLDKIRSRAGLYLGEK